MKADALKCLTLFGSLLSVLGCQQFKGSSSAVSSGESESKAEQVEGVDPTKNTLGFEVCKYKQADGTLSDNCVFAVLADGTCGEAAVKVKSETPADQFACLVEL